MTTEQQLYIDSYRNNPHAAHEAFDLLRVFLKDEFDPTSASMFLQSLRQPPDPDVAERRMDFVLAAQERIEPEDVIEDDAFVCEQAQGAYIQTWKWVPCE